MIAQGLGHIAAILKEARLATKLALERQRNSDLHDQLNSCLDTLQHTVDAAGSNEEKFRSIRRELSTNTTADEKVETIRKIMAK